MKQFALSILLPWIVASVPLIQMVKNEVEPQDKVVTITDSAMFLSYTSNIRIIRPQGCKSEYYARITLIVDHETASDISHSKPGNHLDNTAIVNLREAYHKYYEEHEDTVMIEKVFNDVGYINIEMSKDDLVKLSQQCKTDGHVQFDMNVAVMESSYESEVTSLSDLKSVGSTTETIVARCILETN